MSGAERREYLVGVMVALVCAAVLVFVAMGNRRNPAGDSNTFHLTAEFAKADGLRLGSPVRMAGVTIGAVSELALGSHYRAVVTMRLNGPAPVPTDSAAIIETDGIFGGKYIELQPGGEEENFKTGARITYTQGSVILEDLISLIIQRAKSNQPTAPAEMTAPEAQPTNLPDLDR